MANISLDYKYYLTNVKWTNEYKNVLCFHNKAARDTYFDLANIFSGITDTVNFNITNLYKTTIVIDTVDYITALQSNYIIINDSVKNAYYFYFITNARQTSFNRIELNIELDVFQQYWYDTDFVDCNIRRCKYRLNNYDSSTAGYNLDNENPLCYLSEPFTFETVYKKSYDMKISAVTKNYTDYVYGWMYVFVDPSYNFAGVKIGTSTATTYTFSGYSTSPANSAGLGAYNNIGVMCFPIYKDLHYINIEDVNNSETFALTDASVILDEITSGNNGADASHIYSIKISRRPPFRSKTNFTASGSDIVAKFNSQPSGDFRILSAVTDPDAALSLALFQVGSYVGLRFVMDTDDFYKITCTADNALFSGATAEYYNPKYKITTAQFMPTYIDFGDGNKLEIDYTKARQHNYTNIRLLYKEPITPDITRYSVCIENSDWYSGDNNDGVKYSNTSFTADMSMIFTLDQWAQYLANNKNFYEQGKFNTVMATSKKFLGGAVDVASKNYLGGGMSLVSGLLDAYSFVKNRDYQVDNKKAAVDTVVNQNGSAIADLLIKGIYPSIVVYSIKDSDAGRAINYMKMYGVNTNGLIANIKAYILDDDFKYAYMQADVSEITTGTMSLECEKKLLKIFNDGVRLWFDPATMYNFNL